MKRLSILICLLLFLSNLIFSQKDTVIYYGTNNRPVNEISAIRYIKIQRVKNSKYKVIAYNRNDDKWTKDLTEKTAKSINDSVLLINSIFKKKYKSKTIRKYTSSNGQYSFKDFTEDGKIKQEGYTTCLLPLHLEGELRKYYDNGRLKRVEYYQNNQMYRNENWHEDGETYVTDFFYDIDKMPEYPGGENILITHIRNSLIYPIEAIKNGIQGRVFVEFIINENGKICDAKVVRGVSPSLDREALRVIKSFTGTWSPGLLGDKKVKVGMTVPVNFKLK